MAIKEIKNGLKTRANQIFTPTHTHSKKVPLKCIAIELYMNAQFILLYNLPFYSLAWELQTNGSIHNKPDLKTINMHFKLFMTLFTKTTTCLFYSKN